MNMKVFNRRFSRDYQEMERLEAGISLTGAEVKSAGSGRIKLEDAYVKFLGSEAYLVNAQIPIYRFARPAGYDDRRTRKLLLHRQEIIWLKTKVQSAAGLTVVPISCYNKHGLLKLEIALAKSRKARGKKKLEKKRDIQRQQEREMKEYLRK